jgi:putative hydrolase of the HAD superfamily
MANVKIGVVTDADNTLWNTDRVYAEAQLWLAKQLGGEQQHQSNDGLLAYVREIDQAIASRHHLSLRYPPVLLVTALSRALDGTSLSKAVRDALKGKSFSDDAVTLATEFEAMLRAVPSLRDGVEIGLRNIAQDIKASVLIATESSADRCRRYLEHWQLMPYVDQVMSAPKSPESFARAVKLLGAEPRNCFVIGDQLDRDILFGAKAGCRTIYYPGGFKPKWLPSLEESQPDFTITSFDEAIAPIALAAESAVTTKF